jgi:hypothetical protein
MPARITKQRYHSFLLRLWLVNEQAGVAWRASLENPHTGERLGFASLERLFAFLQDQAAEVATGEAGLPANEGGGYRQ